MDSRRGKLQMQAPLLEAVRWYLQAGFFMATRCLVLFLVLFRRAAMSGSPRSVLQAPEGDGPRALVLGAGVAGVLAAHVACKYCETVTLIEADDLGGAKDAQEVS